MSKRILNRTLYVAVAAALYANAGQAQQAPARADEGELESVVVTGSYIRGTPEDSALPVDVVTAEDLAEQGSPSVVQLVKTITAATSAIGESNRYVGGGGTAEINLRGFGAPRTLLLMNGRRLSSNAVLIGGLQAGGANLNFIPQAAIGQVEILKDGAAATYGSDAIAGVVNFITRRDLDGLELNAEFSAIDGSDGDYQANAAWGTRLENGNILVTFGYRHRSRLDIHERDWAIQNFENASYGGWTGAGNPGTFVFNNSAAPNAQTAFPSPFFTDNGCNQLGGFLQGTTCRYQFSNFNDIVNEEDHYQFHAEFNGRVGDDVNAHTEITWSRDWVPMQRLSPANTTAAFPTDQTSGSLQGTPFINGGRRYNIPAYAPGLQDLIATCATNPVLFLNRSTAGNPAQTATCADLATAGDINNAAAPGVDASPTGWRAIAHAGHPTNPDKADHQSIESKAFRVSAGLNGDIGLIHWDSAVTFMSSRSAVSTNDLLVNRIQEGLNGYLSVPEYGNPCTADDRAALELIGNTRTVADHNNLGCYFFNPFTNSVAVSAVNGQANPFYRGGANPAVINDPLVVQQLYGNYVNKNLSEILVIDGVVSGTTGFTLFSDDEVGWAAGVQYRHTVDQGLYGDNFNNQKTRCVDSIDGGIESPLCDAPSGPLVFFGSATDFRATRGVYAAFAEFSLPILDNLNASLAARYEEYPGNIGSTFDPKLQVKYQIIDWMALRGSLGSTFRAPNPTTVGNNCQTGVANINGTYRAVKTCENPDLKPETADTFNFGILFNPGNLTASVDYYQFKFKDELTVESAARMYAQLNCATSPAALQARFQFAGACNANPVLMTTYYINGPDTDTSGIDLRVQYDFPSIFGGSATLGLEGTYIIEYDRDATYLNGSPTTLIAVAEDRAGHHDLVSAFYSYPKLKGNAFASYRFSDFTFRLQTRYSEGTEQSPGLGIPIATIDDFWQHDLTARWMSPWGLALTASVQNVLDTDPPDAPSMYNYDYTTGNPLGRVFEVGVGMKF
jgi:iron complex outermembrane receptor protein